MGALLVHIKNQERFVTVSANPRSKVGEMHFETGIQEAKEEVSYRLEFDIDDLPKPFNQLARRHWRVVSNESKRWHGLVKSVVWNLKPVSPLKVVDLTLTRISTTEPDFDGLVSSFKFIIDALVECGVIEDDRPSNFFNSMPTYKWERGKRNQGYIKVKLVGVEQ
jgi:hypothetical protein